MISGQSSLAFYCHYKLISQNNLRQRRKYYYLVTDYSIIDSKTSYIAPVAAVDKNENYCNTRRSGKTVKDFNSFGRVGRKRKPKIQNEKPPPSKSLINSSNRLSRPEMCKKQQDLQINKISTNGFYKQTNHGAYSNPGTQVV